MLFPWSVRRIAGPARLAGAIAVFGLAALAPGSAGAVVGGQDGEAALARGAVMVLNSRGGMCSAVVVAPDAVLTAAHCVAGPDAVRVHYRGPDGGPVLVEPAARAIHPGYEPRAVETRKRSVDLALLRTPEPLPGRFVPAALSASSAPKGEAVTVGGFGVAREGDARSTGTFRVAALRAVEPYGPARILLWASDPDGRGRGACEGDSGGPLFVEAGSVAAVTSWAAGAGRRGCGGVTQGVLLGPQRAWLDRTLSAWGRTASWR